MKNKKELNQLVLYKRQEESIRKGGIDSNLQIKDFTYFKKEFNDELLKEFDNMQNKYILNDKFKINIENVKETIDEVYNMF